MCIVRTTKWWKWRAREPKTKNNNNKNQNKMNERMNERSSKRTDGRANEDQIRIKHLHIHSKCMGHFHEFSELCADDGINIFFWRAILLKHLTICLLRACCSILLRYCHQCRGTAVILLLFSNIHCLCVFVYECRMFVYFLEPYFDERLLVERLLSKNQYHHARTHVNRVELLHAPHMHTHRYTVTDNASIVVVHFHSVEQCVHHYAQLYDFLCCTPSPPLPIDVKFV